MTVMREDIKMAAGNLQMRVGHHAGRKEGTRGIG